jgi:hypothetical protein
MQKEIIRKSESMAQPPVGTNQQGGEARAEGKSSEIRYASDEQFEKAHRKTSTLHAGLFRRLAK